MTWMHKTRPPFLCSSLPNSWETRPLEWLTVHATVSSVTEPYNQEQCGMKEYRLKSVQNSVKHTHSHVWHTASLHWLSVTAFLIYCCSWWRWSQISCQHLGVGESSHSEKSASWKLLQCKGKRQAAEEVEDHSLNFSGDMRGKERRAWEATQQAC